MAHYLLTAAHAYLWPRKRIQVAMGYRSVICASALAMDVLNLMWRPFKQAIMTSVRV